MGLNVGLVCEGSHDYIVLSNFVSQIIREFGETVNSIDALQPKISATFQITGGGWTEVRSWCRQDHGQGYRKYLDKPIFASSKHYDILIIHVDGDVVSLCNDHPLDSLDIEGMPIEDIVTALKDAIMNHWLSVDPSHSERIVSCIPVRHIESWLSVAVGPSIPNCETINLKDLFRSGPAKSLAKEWRDCYRKSAIEAAKHTGKIRSECISYQTFEADLRTSAELC